MIEQNTLVGLDSDKESPSAERGVWRFSAAKVNYFFKKMEGI